MGLDIACVTDMDLSGATVEGDSELAQRVYGRLSTARGTLIDDDSYGILLEAYAGLNDVAETIVIDCESEVRREPGAEDAIVETIQNNGSVVSIQIKIGAASIDIPVLEGSSSVLAPTVTSVSPSSGLSIPGMLRINGTNLKGVTSVTFGGYLLPYFAAENSSTVHAQLDLTIGAPVDVTVTTPGGSATLVGGYG